MSERDRMLTKPSTSIRVISDVTDTKKPKTLHHYDCKTKLMNGRCPKCGYPPDMQSTYLA